LRVGLTRPTGRFVVDDTGRPVGLLAPGLLDDFLGNAPRNFGVVAELHRVHRTALGLRPQVPDVPEHFGQRHQRADHLNTTGVLHRLDLAAPRIQVADHVPHVLFRGPYLDVHHRLQQHRLGALDAFLQCHGTGDLESHLGGVDVVVGAVHQSGLDPHQRITGERTAGHRLLDAGIHARDVLAWDASTGDLVVELVELTLGGVQRYEGHLHLVEMY